MLSLKKKKKKTKCISLLIQESLEMSLKESLLITYLEKLSSI